MKMTAIAAAIAVAIGAGSGAHAQGYPSHPITMIVPFPAGGPTDTLARILSERMRLSLGQPVIIETVTGAGASIGVARAAQAAPDGYTLSIGNWTSHVGAGAIYPVNPKYPTVLNHVCYPSLTDLPEAPDVVVFSIRNPLIPEQVRLAIRRGARAAVIYDSGFAELGEDGIRVNGINPDGVVRGSGIFAGGWGAQRAAVYGIPESELGAFYAKRTLLGREVLPEHVAAAVLVLTAGELSLTTGLHIPVDSGVAAGFLR